MKTKYLILFFGLFCCMGIKAIEREISLQNCTDKKDTWKKDKRSITLEPTATIDGNIIRIYSDITIENINITVKTNLGETVYSNTTTYPSKCYTLELGNLGKEEYYLVLTVDESTFYGYFSIF